MNWSKKWNAGVPPMWPEQKQTETTTFHYLAEPVLLKDVIDDLSKPVVIGVDYASGPDICIVQMELKDGTFTGQLVGDLVVYNNWGWKVAHYPTMTRFDKAVPQGSFTKEQLLSWCDKVQSVNGSLWAILRELTPDTFDDSSARVMQAKDKIRTHCLDTEIE